MLGVMGREIRTYGHSALSRERDLALSWLVSDVMDLTADQDDTDDRPEVVPAAYRVRAHSEHS